MGQDSNYGSGREFHVEEKPQRKTSTWNRKKGRKGNQSMMAFKDPEKCACFQFLVALWDPLMAEAWERRQDPSA